MPTKHFSRIGIIGAMQVEIEGLRAQLTDAKETVVSGVTFTTGQLCGREVVLAVSGIGKVFAAIATEAMIVSFGVDAILNTGVAGGLAEGLTVGDLVLAADVVQHDMNTTAFGDPRGLLSGLDLVRLPADKALLAILQDAAATTGRRVMVGTVASGDLFVAEEKTKQHIKEHFGAAACEMEGAAIGLAAYQNKIPFAVLRTISDGGDGMEYSQFVTVAANISTTVTMEFLKRLN